MRQVIELDVDNDKSVLDAINRIATENGRIDIVVNNAGYALIGAFEENSMEEIKAQFETNLFGSTRVMQAVIPIMRKQRNGKIVNISSVGGRIAIPFDSIYHGTKFALEGLEPGAVGSNFWKKLKMAAKTFGLDNNSPYRELANNMSETFKQLAQNAIHPSEVAKVIVQAV